MKNERTLLSKCHKTGINAIILLFLAFVSNYSYGQIILLNPTGDGGFENGSTFAANGWTAIGTTSPTWYVGTAAGAQGGSNSAFIGTNSTTFGSSNTTRISHIYRDLTIPAGSQNVSLSFYLKYPAIDNTYDYIYSYITTTSYTPVDGTLPGAGYNQIFAYTNPVISNFTQQTPIDLTSYAGSTIRLVFTFKNDGVDPPAYFAIDNISLTYDNNNFTKTYTSSGYFTAPTGVTSVSAACWGGGGGGGGNDTTEDGGGGGGGGAYSKTNSIAVTPNATYGVNVGYGGYQYSTTAGAQSLSGGDSWFKDVSTILAKGGAGGSNTSGGSPGAGGVGGASASGIGDTKYSGGNGSAGLTNNAGTGGGGGSSAGTGADGIAGEINAGGLAPTGGGNGGSGGTGTSNGQNGSTPGGGGGGSAEIAYGGDGANGKVTISYTCITITTQPINQTLCAGGSSEFSISSSTPSLSYQWQYNGVNVTNGVPAGAVYNGTNSSTLQISGSIAAGTYSGYQCLLSNSCGSLSSNSVQLTVNATAAPATPSNPTASSMACSVTLTASGTPPANVNWYWQGQSCGNSTALGFSSTYNPPVAGTYNLRAYNTLLGCWSASCGSVVAPVLGAPVFITNPASQNGCVGSSVTFNIIATGSGLTYQWRKNGTNITGATSDTYTIGSIVAGDAGNYDCVVTGTCSTANSTAATLTILGSGLSGIKTVGTTGNYTTLKSAFDAINANGLSGNLELQIISNITETAEASLNQWVDCAGVNGYSITIYPTGATRTISGSITTSLITFNGADRVTFDGRLNQSGAANSLILSNTNTGGSTLKFINDACMNTISYTTLKGVYSTDLYNGVVYFSSGSTTGNDKNSILFCNIQDGTTTPTNGIYSYGTFGKENDYNTVSGCNIFNFWNTYYNSSGIYISGGNNAWTITNNSFYQTVSRPDWKFSGIYIISSNGNDYNISGNYIGGQAPLCAGGPWTISDTSYNSNVTAIYLKSSSNGVSTISNNMIKNFDISMKIESDQDDAFTGIFSSGRINVLGNTIGDNSTGSIKLNCIAGSTSTWTGWNIGILKYGDGNVMNNRIGSITINGTVISQLGFNAIQVGGSLINDVIISGNVIGNETTANSISTASGATPAATIGGIYFGTDGNYNTTVSNNTIANINNNCTGTGAFFVGLYNEATNGKQVVIGNIIKNISVASTRTSDWSTVGLMSAVTGIASINSTNGGHSIANNTINSLSSTGTGTVQVFGIVCHHDNTVGTTIEKNNIYNLTASSNSAKITGIKTFNGIATLKNNMISLGTGISTTANIYGIWQASSSACNYLFNSVYIGGSVTSSSSIHTYGFKRDYNASIVLKNNIFYNARLATGGGTGKHFSIVTNTNTLTSDYNDLFTVTAGANLGSYDGGNTPRDFGAWKTGTSQDTNSLNVDPLFVNTASNLHLQDGSPAKGVGIAGTGVLIDFDNQIRKTGVSPNGPCIGADENLAVPYGTNTYGIYASDGINGNITDCEIYAQGGSPGGIGILVGGPNDLNWANVNISGYQTITATNSSCLNSNITYNTGSSAPNWLLGNGATVASSNNSTTITQYVSTGRKDILENVKVFKDFTNMTMPIPSSGSILGAPSGAGCPTTYNYTSSVAGNAGYEYMWTATAPTGCTATIENPTMATTNITFQNPTGYNQVFLLTLNIKSECCGPLETVNRYITIFPGPTQPTVTGSPFTLCTGGSFTVNVNSPDPSYAYDWYDAVTGGNLLGSGTSLNVTNAPTGTNHYYVQSTNSFGCSSPRTDIVQIGNDATPPSVNDQQTCGANSVSLIINSPQPGYTYNWYLSSCNGTLLQSSSSSVLSYNLTANTTFYVSAVPAGCAPSSCITVNASIITPTDPITWLGTIGGTNNWFEPSNWQNGCLPTCETNVSIPVTANNPDIGFNPSDVARSKNITIQTGASLTFSDSKAELNICGDFIHTGTLTTNSMGAVKFTGSALQYYTKTGSGNFHNVTLNNSSNLNLNSTMTLDETGTLSFVNGKIITGANWLVITNPDPASIDNHGTNRYVYGNLRRHINSGTYTYSLPVGSSSRYTLAELINSDLLGVTYLDATFITPYTSTGSLNPSIANDGGLVYTSIATEGIWRIDPNTAPSSGSYSIKLWFDDGGGSNPFSGLTDNLFNPLKRTSGSTLASDWTAIGGSPNAANTPGTTVADGFSQRTGWTSFSEYAIGIATSGLPVELIHLNSICDKNSIKIKWTSSSETNNHYYILEQSSDGIMWNFVDRINGAGNSNLPLNYEYSYNQFTSESSYTRLSQFDYNGNKKVLGVTTSYCNNEIEPHLYVYPNPTDGVINIVIKGDVADQGSVNIYDNIGQLIISKSVLIENRSTITVIDMSNFAPGSYYLKFIMNKSTLPTQKLILNK